LSCFVITEVLAIFCLLWGAYIIADGLVGAGGGDNVPVLMVLDNFGRFIHGSLDISLNKNYISVILLTISFSKSWNMPPSLIPPPPPHLHLCKSV
jgi:hypothetical protein